MGGVVEIEAALDGVDIDAHAGLSTLGAEIVVLDGDEEMANALELFVMILGPLADLGDIILYFLQ